MVSKFFDKKSALLANKSTAGSGLNSIPNQQLADECHKQINRKFKRRKVYSSFQYWGCWWEGVAGPADA